MSTEEVGGVKRRDVPRALDAAVGGYALDLYCQHPDHDDDYSRDIREGGGNARYVAPSPFSFTGETWAEATAQARRAGWWISRPDISGARAVLCPFHARETPR